MFSLSLLTTVCSTKRERGYPCKKAKETQIDLEKQDKRVKAFFMKETVDPLLIKKTLFLLIEGARLKTLPAVLVPVAMSCAWAFYQTEVFKADIFFFTSFSALFIQIAANFFNDALDSEEEMDTISRKGPERLVQSGKMSFSQVQSFGFLFGLIALLMGIPLVLRGGWPILVLGLLSCLLAYFYTGTRFSLLKTGLSELCCFLFFGLFAVSGSYYLQTLKWDISLIYLGIQCGFWAVSILLINHLRDEEEDLEGGRKHFVTLYGRTHSLFFLLVIQAFIYLLCFLWLGKGLMAGAWTFFVLPFSALLLYFVFITPPSKKYNLYLALCSLLYILFGGTWVIGLLLE